MGGTKLQDTMYRVTTEPLPLGVLDTLDFSDVIKFGGSIEKITKILTEYYQYHAVCHSKTTKKDYSYLEQLIDKYVYELKFFK